MHHSLGYVYKCMDVNTGETGIFPEARLKIWKGDFSSKIRDMGEVFEEMECKHHVKKTDELLSD